MQIFRVSPNHGVSAKYLDNRRLSKQILELYQIIRVCLAHMELIEGNTKYIHHPIVQHVYNDGNPYIIDTFQLLKEMNKEHIRRGGKRSESFKQDLSNLALIIDKNRSHFSDENLPPIYVYGNDKIYGDTAYEEYIKLLYYKWQNDKIPARCNCLINV
ncbi:MULTISPECIES: pyrimidine dimer DNA glycosylase/endonuclease V [Mammaliicoccus]|uniref:pyrimidine dimer DNA glycosylase/endonuclease V n=1 Tax=Mammaliicoccus TaxID=2803850 RepID=UPI001C4E8D64|nr:MULTISPECIES: pyrimidine dimer DNA glycosylase/endonuclease V [Mammaliicoccus]MBW0766208.1 hypothetical protein [Mammaliicoccus lentus]MDQ7143202.1 pyrimidine dimer DNA glycosylase/endonuclease V [Mammaliicoccus lentus]WHI54764.1 pyrimidine dimer DNA glycosylase/endonuclease V [Mammaliicoccus lentus]WHI57287.1 pyrimidine dimer DNA glycosylase/endonuclease V [Mammaliicoccus lentus]WHI65132.1 pyrimidine dimer DNA glycosylase/endonuclease V [Mammaliicoccus lentus]